MPRRSSRIPKRTEGVRDWHFLCVSRPKQNKLGLQAMSIGPVSQNWSSYLSTADNLIQNTITGQGDSTDPRSIIGEIVNGRGGLLGYQEKQEEKKVEEQVLASLGLKDGDLKNLSPEQLANVEKAVAKALQQRIENSMKEQAQQQAEARAKQVFGSNGTSLLSDDTTAALFELQ